MKKVIVSLAALITLGLAVVNANGFTESPASEQSAQVEDEVKKSNEEVTNKESKKQKKAPAKEDAIETITDADVIAEL